MALLSGKTIDNTEQALSTNLETLVRWPEMSVVSWLRGEETTDISGYLSGKFVQLILSIPLCNKIQLHCFSMLHP